LLPSQDIPTTSAAPLRLFSDDSRPLTQPASLRAAVRADAARYFAPGSSFASRLRVFIDTPGFQAVLLYRFGNFVTRRVRVRILRLPLALLHYLLQKLCIICWGIYIDAGADIGPGLYVGHFGGIIVGPVRMGRDCNIAHNVTIGLRVDGPSGVPTFGDNVWIGTGAVIYGPVTVGSGVMIGPNSVVSRSIPDRTMVLGSPMRVISTDYDNYSAIYGHPRHATVESTGG
jgi:serine O-acetyltransferase